VNGLPRGRIWTLFQSRGAFDHVIDIDLAKCHGNRPLGLGEGRPYDFIDQRGCRRERFHLIRGSRRSQNVIGCNAIALASEFVAAMGPSDTF
jgi:hypothetical protein